MKKMKELLRCLLRWIAIIAFFQGFFLMKRNIDQVATEKNLSIESYLFGDTFEISKEFFEYKNIVLFIIDGLRFDFLKYQVNQSCQPLPYNCFSSLHELMHSKPSQSMFYSLKVDPPTVTSPRLKALTTGSPPTFLSAAANLNSARVQQDNLIQQLARTNDYHLLTFGDDTWKALFPEEFHDYFVFDSFNTRDLDTVDNGILSKLQELDFSTLSGDRKRFMVFHFLGVDHIGHTYHAYHPLMAERLQRMDEVIMSLMTDTAFRNNSLFLIMGDHGMTNDGEHGGASYEETTSGIFIHSTVTANNAYPTDSCFLHPTSTISPNELLSNPRSISQIDLIPFLSLMAQIPIAFGSLGIIPPELLLSSISHPSQAANKHLRLLIGISANANQVWEALIVYLNKPLTPIFSHLTSDMNLSEKLSSLYEQLEVMTQQLETQRNYDHKFYELWLLYSQTIRSHLNLIEQYQQIVEDDDQISKITQFYYQFLQAAQIEMRSRWTEYNYLFLIFGLFLGLLVVLSDLSLYWQSITASFISVFLFCCYLLSYAGAGSNSFILQEQEIIFYFVQSCSLLLLSYQFISKKERSCGLKNESKSEVRRELWQISSTFWKETLLPLLMIFLFPTINRYLYQWYRHHDSLNSSHSLPMNLPIMGVLLILSVRIGEYLYFRSTQDSNPSLIYESSTWITQAIQLYWYYQREIQQQHSGYLVMIIMTLSAGTILHLSVYSKSLTNASQWRLIFLHAIIMISNFYSFARYCYFWIGIVLLQEMIPWILSSLASESPKVLSWSIIIFTSFWERYLYFLTGHGMSFDTLQLSAAFVMVEKFEFYIGGLSLFVNTFGSLLIVMILFKYEIAQNPSLFSFILIKKWVSLRFMGVMINFITLFVLRHHLMLWDIFAPKTIFEISFFAVASTLSWII